jgi:hypothetical protein
VTARLQREGIHGCFTGKQPRLWRPVMNRNGTNVIIANVTGAGWIGKNTGGRASPTREEIARLAYDRYEVNGRQDGHDLEDWLLAEQELARHFA